MKKILIGCVLVVGFLFIAFLVGSFFIVRSWKKNPDKYNASIALQPGEMQFIKADELILASNKGIYHGNTPEAREYAQKFSVNIKQLQSQIFEGGKKNRKISLTKGDFLTYCHFQGNKAVFLVHVPQFKRYKGKVRDTLLQLSWALAEKIISQSKPGENFDIVVGLRGAVFYGGRAYGRTGNKPLLENSFSIDKAVFYKYFVEPTRTPVSESKNEKEPNKQSIKDNAGQPKQPDATGASTIN